MILERTMHHRLKLILSYYNKISAPKGGQGAWPRHLTLPSIGLDGWMARIVPFPIFFKKSLDCREIQPPSSLLSQTFFRKSPLPLAKSTHSLTSSLRYFSKKAITYIKMDLQSNLPGSEKFACKPSVFIKSTRRPNPLSCFFIKTLKFLLNQIATRSIHYFFTSKTIRTI